MMRICVVGGGYVGLVTAACFSDFGHSVIVIDSNEEKIESLLGGKIPIYEPGLDHLIMQGVKNKLLGFSTELSLVVAESDIVMIAVGTPPHPLSGHADLSAVYQVAQDIAKSLSKYSVIVTKSTVPVGTSEHIASIIKKTRPDLERHVNYDVVSNPEFLREGSAISDFMRPDRIVVGSDSAKAQEVLKNLYRPLYLRETPFVFTDIATSELIKYASNAFLATKISFTNQIADLCEKTGANIKDVTKGMGLDGRIGNKFLHVSPGYGGSCFPKDTRALCRTAEEFGVDLSIVNAASRANDLRKATMGNRILDALREKYGTFTDKEVAILGITFKPNTDDLRDAPSLSIIPHLLQSSCRVRIYDPLYNKNACQSTLPHELKDAILASDPYEAADQAHALVILTEWNSFRALNLEKIANLLEGKPSPLFIDYRNIYSASDMRLFDYRSLGR
jgi:UDPglucose 6-dehydrogenase